MKVLPTKTCKQRIRAVGGAKGWLLYLAIRRIPDLERRRFVPIDPKGPGGEPRHMVDVGGGYTATVRTVDEGFVVEDLLTEGEVAELEAATRRAAADIPDDE